MINHIIEWRYSVARMANDGASVDFIRGCRRVESISYLYQQMVIATKVRAIKQNTNRYLRSGK